MKTFEVEGWYRYSNGNEKHFEIETIIANTPEEAIYYFTTIYLNLHFFKIIIKEI
jgi:hypothetical protein